jgi:protein-tyrosine phosphatase
MKFSRLLVLCEANICRSPLAAHLLHDLTDLRIDSAGLTAREGDPADSVYVDMAQTLELDLTEHRSKPVNRELLTEADLILVMTGGHKRRLSERHPQFSGKIMLLGQWIDGGTPISDPHRKSVDAYQQVFKQIRDACDRWAAKL